MENLLGATDGEKVSCFDSNVVIMSYSLLQHELVANWLASSSAEIHRN
jgi:hypothetical protein